MKQRVKQSPSGASIAERLDFHACIEHGTGCWLWGGGIGNKYGRLKIKTKMFSAHRLSWERWNGPIPDGLCVCHKCDVPSCVNPEHLFLGTQKDNMRDAQNKDRYYKGKGEKNGRAKLTEKQVVEIFHDLRGYRVIANDYSVCEATVGHIKSGKNWSHLNLLKGEAE